MRALYPPHACPGTRPGGTTGNARSDFQYCKQPKDLRLHRGLPDVPRRRPAAARGGERGLDARSKVEGTAVPGTYLQDHPEITYRIIN